jgi:hypothetical protein
MDPGTGAGWKVRSMVWVLVLIAVTSTTALAQLEVGDYTKLNLSGYLGFGYTGGWGSTTSSAHGTSIIGDLNLNGYYYHPNLLSFNVHPFYNRNQANSVTQTTANTSGFESSVNLFTGSHFPGSVSFSKQFFNAGEFGIPGAGFLSTDGSSQNFAVSWSELLPNYPTLTANFSDYGSSSTIVGATTQSEFSGLSLNLNSTYALAGFNLLGFYGYQSFNATVPDFLNSAMQTDTSSSTFGVSANHKIPLSGSFGASWNHSSYRPDGQDYGKNAFDNLLTTVSVQPTKRLVVTTQVNYVNNVAGLLQQTIATGGVFAPQVVDSTSSAVAANTQASYALWRNLGVTGYVNYIYQDFQGRQTSSTQYGGLMTFRYARPLFGVLFFNFGLVDTANQTGSNSLGFTGNLGMSRNFGRWETSADFSYQQSVQSVANLYTTSGVNYGGYVRRRLTMDMSFNANYRGTHNALTQIEGNSNRTDSMTVGFNWRRYSVSGAYSKSNGSSVLASNGTLVSTPVGPLITPNVMYFDGKAYTVSLSAVPTKRLKIYGYYTEVKSQTQSVLYSSNYGKRYNALIEYNVRKLAIRGGYTRTQQDISAVSAVPAVVNSYFFNISRWFDIF